MAVAVAETPSPADAFAARNQRWNLPVLLAEAWSFLFGVAAFDSATILPLLLATLGASREVIGLLSAVQVLGFAVPAMVAAHWIHGRSQHKSVLLLTSGVGRAAVLSLPWAVWAFSASRPTLAIAWCLGVVALFWFCDGFCAVSWTDIVAKTVLPRARGAFFGLLQTVGGVASIVAAGIIALVLRDHAVAFPANYAILAGCWAFGSIGSFTLLSLIREPPGPHIEKEDQPGFGEFLRLGIPLLRRNPRLRTLVFARWLLGGAGMALPFYALFATEDLVQPLVVVGGYVGARSLGRILGGGLWGWVSHRWGPSVGVRYVSIAVAMVPCLALAITRPVAWVLFPCFFLQGAVDDGLWCSCQNTLYEAVSEHDRPLAVGITTVALAPIALYGWLGGWIATVAGCRPAFAAAAVCCSLGAALAWRMPSMQTSAHDHP